MGKKPEDKIPVRQEDTHERHLQYPQESWTEVDAEGDDSEMAQGRESQEPFYTPLVSEAAERRVKKERQERVLREAESQTESDEPDEASGGDQEK